MSTVHNTSAAHDYTTARNPGGINDSAASTTSVAVNNPSDILMQQQLDEIMAEWDESEIQRLQHLIYHRSRIAEGVYNPAALLRRRYYHTPLSSIPARAWKVDDIMKEKLGVALYRGSNDEYPTLYARAVAGKELRKKYWEAYDLHCAYPMFTAAVWEQMEPYDRELIQDALRGRIGRV